MVTAFTIEQITTAVSALAITGAVVSILAQLTKKLLPNSPSSKMLWVVALSALGGTALYIFQFVPAAWWQVALGVWGMANTVYLAIVKWTEKEN